MKKSLILSAFFAPLVLFWAVALPLVYFSHTTLYSAFVLPYFVVCFVVALLLAFFFLLDFIRKKNPFRKKECIISAALALGLLVTLVSSPLMLPVVWNLKKPARQRVAQRIIALAREEGYTDGSKVNLQKDESHLSDYGIVYYYTDGKVSAVLFWDTQGAQGAYGLLHGSGSIYVSAPRVRPPVSASDFVWHERDSGHWWIGSE
ncbi:MAG: hypothetical protein FWF45_05085 [Coriobacteriia bacterium]|nr:hypothetical protein [Coriobacteriia bacterium]